jgi:hypothetical protein
MSDNVSYHPCRTGDNSDYHPTCGSVQNLVKGSKAPNGTLKTEVHQNRSTQWNASTHVADAIGCNARYEATVKRLLQSSKFLALLRAFEAKSKPASSCFNPIQARPAGRPGGHGNLPHGGYVGMPRCSNTQRWIGNRCCFHLSSVKTSNFDNGSESLQQRGDKYNRVANDQKRPLLAFATLLYLHLHEYQRRRRWQRLVALLSALQVWHTSSRICTGFHHFALLLVLHSRCSAWYGDVFEPLIRVSALCLIRCEFATRTQFQD